jgi:hypothetical protein
MPGSRSRNREPKAIAFKLLFRDIVTLQTIPQNFGLDTATRLR